METGEAGMEVGVEVGVMEAGVVVKVVEEAMAGQVGGCCRRMHARVSDDERWREL